MRIFVSPNRKDSDPFEVRAKGAHLRRLCREFGAQPIGEDSESFTVRLKSLEKADLANFLEMTGARGVELGPEDAGLLAHGDPIGTAAIEKEMTAENFNGMACIDELGERIDFLSEALWRIPADSEDTKTFDALLENIEAPVPQSAPQADPWDAALAQTPEESEMERKLLEQNLAACNADPRGIIRY